MTKQTKKSKKISLPSWRTVFLVYSVIVSTITLGALLLFISGYQTQQRYFADTDFKQLVRDTQLAMYQTPYRLGDKLMFPDMKLSIPATADTRMLLYEYQEAIDEPGFDIAASASFGSKPAVYNTSKPLEQLTCGRLADVTFDEKGEDRGGETFPLVGEKQLSDKRMMYVYQNKANCTNVWSGMDSETLVKLLLQAESTN